MIFCGWGSGSWKLDPEPQYDSAYASVSLDNTEGRRAISWLVVCGLIQVAIGRGQITSLV